MKLLILHLGDIHFRAGRPNPTADRAQAIVNAAFGVYPEAEHVLVVISGDVAFGGSVDDYAIAKIFFDKLLSSLRSKKSGNISLEIVAVPGNHDCDFSSDQAARGRILQDLGDSDLQTESIAKLLAGVQSEFFDFAEAIGAKTAGIASGNSSGVELDFAGERIRVLLVNSAICSVIKEQPGSLRLAGLPSLETLLSAPRPLITISVCHHPMHWFNDTGFHALRSFMLENRAFLLTGHEHQPNLLETRRDDASIIQVEGGVLQDSSAPAVSSFNAISIDTNEKSIFVSTLSWNSTVYTVASRKPLPWVMSDGEAKGNRLKLTPSFSRDLEDLGDLVSHPRPTEISLSDLYCPLDLRKEPGLLEKGKDWSLVRGRDVPAELLDSRLCYIHGPARSGKTSLAKKLFSTWWREGHLPLLISARDLRAHDATNLDKSIAKAIAKIYAVPNIEQYLHAGEKKILLIDDLAGISENATHFERILVRLSARFDAVVLLSGSSLRIRDLVRDGQVLPKLSEVARYSVLAMSSQARSELIDKWSKIGLSPLESAKDVKASCIGLERQIDELIGRDLIPATPFYVLSLLSALGQGISPKSGLGSLGYLYDLLIRSSLAKSVKQTDLMQVMDTFLSQLAYGMFVNSQSALLVDDFKDRCKQFAEEYLIRMEGEQALRMLTDALILTERSGQVYFRYKYVLFFYVARHISQRLSTKAGQDAVTGLLGRVHHQDSGDVLAFLSHCTADPFIATSLKAEIDKLFAGQPGVDLDKDVKFLNTLGGDLASVSSLALPESDPEESRQGLMRERDGNAGNNGSSDDVAEIDFYDREAEASGESEALGRQIASAFRLLEITGQALRNHPTQIAGVDKLSLLRSSNQLVRRMMGSMLQMMEQCSEQYLPALEEAVMRKPGIGARDKAVLLSKLIFRFEVEQSAIGILLGYASTMGGEMVLPLAERLRQEQGESFDDILGLAVRLESPNKFPEAEAFRLRERFADNHFVKNCLRMLVYMNLYIYRVSDHRQKQRICQKFDIKHSDPALLLEARRKA